MLINCPRLTHLSLTGIHEFIRRDISEYCREPPPEFNDHQREVFCVFSGEGVHKLRDHLREKYRIPPAGDAVLDSDGTVTSMHTGSLAHHQQTWPAQQHHEYPFTMDHVTPNTHQQDSAPATPTFMNTGPHALPPQIPPPTLAAALAVAIPDEADEDFGDEGETNYTHGAEDD